MSRITIAFSSIPESHRKPLLDEYNTIIQNYFEQRWSPSELSGGRFSEIVYSIIHSLISNSFPSSPQKPRNMVEACKRLENETALCRSFRILIPRMLPVLYEIRNNRNVGHVGGDINPNQMDSQTVLTLSNWILAEMVRVLHNIDIIEAEKIVSIITEKRIPLIWSDKDIKRVLNPKMSLKDQILLLLASSNESVLVEDLQKWCDYLNSTYFKKQIRKLHAERFVEYKQKSNTVLLLPPGSNYISDIIKELNGTTT